MRSDTAQGGTGELHRLKRAAGQRCRLNRPTLCVAVNVAEGEENWETMRGNRSESRVHGGRVSPRVTASVMSSQMVRERHQLPLHVSTSSSSPMFRLRQRDSIVSIFFELRDVLESGPSIICAPIPTCAPIPLAPLPATYAPVHKTNDGNECISEPDLDLPPSRARLVDDGIGTHRVAQAHPAPLRRKPVQPHHLAQPRAFAYATAGAHSRPVLCRGTSQWEILISGPRSDSRVLDSLSLLSHL